MNLFVAVENDQRTLISSFTKETTNLIILGLRCPFGNSCPRGPFHTLRDGPCDDICTRCRRPRFAEVFTIFGEYSYCSTCISEHRLHTLQKYSGLHLNPWDSETKMRKHLRWLLEPRPFITTKPYMEQLDLTRHVIQLYDMANQNQYLRNLEPLTIELRRCILEILCSLPHKEMNHFHSETFNGESEESEEIVDSYITVSCRIDQNTVAHVPVPTNFQDYEFQGKRVSTDILNIETTGMVLIARFDPKTNRVRKDKRRVWYDEETNRIFISIANDPKCFLEKKNV